MSEKQSSQTENAQENMLKKSYKNVGLMMLVQIFSKILTFTLNFLIARVVAQEVFGYANIQIQLFNAMILWFSKESVRKIVQRSVQQPENSQPQESDQLIKKESQKPQKQLSKKQQEILIGKSANNLVLFSFFVQMIIGICLYFGVIIFDNQPNLKQFNISILLIVVAALIENLCEPFYVEMLMNMDFSLRAKAESISIFVKSVLTYVLIYYGDLGLLAYALAQVSYSLCLFCVYFTLNYQKTQTESLNSISEKFFTISQIKSDIKSSNKQFLSFSSILATFQKYVIPEHLSDLRQFTQICLVKFLLTEGEKIVIFYLSTQSQKYDSQQQQETILRAAEFSLISNLISIICRFIFQPLEEIAYNLFSKLKITEAEKKSLSKEQLQMKNQSNLDILTQYLAGVIGIGVASIIFSFVCGSPFILFVYSQKWATQSTVNIMRAYCVNLLFMALNGMAEAFAYGLANQKVLQSLQGLLIYNSIIYVLAVVFFSNKFGVIGLVYANCINMAVRGFCSLKISIDCMNREMEENDKKSGRNCFSLFRLILNVFIHKVFIAILFMSIAGTFLAEYVLNYAIQYIQFRKQQIQ